jgi:phosphoribosyl 1,2-cyclic phosphate phosphodiesterase
VVESNRGTRILIDTPPELRLQLIAAAIDRVDAVLYTHAHADHTHGIDDLRAITIRRSAPLPIYGPAETLDALAHKFRYIFDDDMRPLPGTSKPEGKAHVVEAGQGFSIADLDIMPVSVPHGSVTVFAYRIGPLAYVTDAKSLPSSAIALLRGASVLVINALFRTEHPTHLSIPEAVAAAREIGAERTYLTHLTHDNFHANLEAELPRGVVPAFDGLTVRID